MYQSNLIRLSTAAVMAVGLQSAGGTAGRARGCRRAGQPSDRHRVPLPGQWPHFGLGEQVCLKTPSGYRIAECSMQQNVTSWAVRKEECMVNARLDAMVATLRSGRAALTGP